MNGVHMKMVCNFCCLSRKQGLNHLYFTSSTSIMQRCITVFVCQLVIRLFLQSFEKCLFSAINGCHMQYILPLWIRNSQTKPFLFENLSNSCLVFQVCKHERVAFERITFIKQQIILERYLLQVSTHCFLVAFA